MTRTILVLEDDCERVRRFCACFAGLSPAVEVRIWRDAKKMVRECGVYLHRCALICLDHDLVPEHGGIDPGDGLELAKYLAPLAPKCPIVIHSSNSTRACQMLGEFQLHSCEAFTVLPELLVAEGTGSAGANARWLRSWA